MEMIAKRVGFFEAIMQGEFSTTKSDLGYLRGRKSTTLKKHLKADYINNLQLKENEKR